MSDIIDELITDRTQNDVKRIKELKNKILKNGISALTQEERTEYFNNIVKGSYNYTDLNRVANACAYLYQILKKQGYGVWGYTPLKTDWQIEDIPTLEDMTTYINTIKALKNTFPTIQTIPDNMKFLDFNGANNIEKLLVEVKEIYNLLLLSPIYCGEANSGEF